MTLWSQGNNFTAVSGLPFIENLIRMDTSLRLFDEMLQDRHVMIKELLCLLVVWCFSFAAVTTTTPRLL
jgi:hypothetical protein